MKPKKDLLEIRNQPFDGSKALWIPYSDTGYTKAELIGDGDKPGTKKVRRIIDNKEKDMKDEQIEKQNPPKYELLEDLANMTYLSEASVVYNLSERYKIYNFVSYFIKRTTKIFRYVKFLIYTYSGLFCVTINPYKWLPVYDNHVVGCYKGKRKSEMPPHIFSISDNAYNDMLRERHNQVGILLNFDPLKSLT